MLTVRAIGLLLGGVGIAWGAPPEAVWVGGNIHTLDADRPRVAALAVADGRIVALGTDAEVLALAGPATVRHDLGGRTVLPGLIDAHGHLLGLGSFGLGRLDLSQARSFADVVAQVEAKAAELRAAGGAGRWVLGGRWDHESWAERALPTHAALSAAVPDLPVWLTRVDGHAGIANAKALKLAGITRASAPPPGGAILRDAEGDPTGVLVDNATVLVERLIGGAGNSTEAVLLEAQRMCLAVGLTGVHEAGMSPAEIGALQDLERAGRWKLRTYVMVSGGAAPEYFRTHGVTVGRRVTVRACKLYMDGAMGSRGAWLLAPYADRPTDEHGAPYTGLNLTDPARIEEIARDALEQGYQVCTHAIGDRANRAVLDAYERALRAHPQKDHRFRIEHAQLLAPEDIGRFAALGVVASMQPTHCTSDMRWVEARVGPERAAGAYAWARLLRAGARLALGSDFPVESPDPMLGLYAAVTRQTADGEPAGGWRPGERLTRTEALAGFTRGAAWAGFAEEEQGVLAIGSWADFSAWSADPLTCPVDELPAIRAELTVVNGEVVHGGAD